jgi:AraC-like DNA-binding protein
VFLINLDSFESAAERIVPGGRKELRQRLAKAPVIFSRNAARLKELIFQLSLYREPPKDALHPQHPFPSVLHDLSILNEILFMVAENGESRSPKDRVDSTWLSDALHIINSFANRRISLDEIAQGCSLSKSHLCRKFLRATGMTVLDYLNQLRVYNSFQLLRSNGLSVTETAFELGYSSVSNFISAFKRISGLTPKQWALKMDSGEALTPVAAEAKEERGSKIDTSAPARIADHTWQQPSPAAGDFSIATPPQE